MTIIDEISWIESKIPSELHTKNLRLYIMKMVKGGQKSIQYPNTYSSNIGKISKDLGSAILKQWKLLFWKVDTISDFCLLPFGNDTIKQQLHLGNKNFLL